MELYAFKIIRVSFTTVPDEDNGTWHIEYMVAVNNSAYIGSILAEVLMSVFIISITFNL